MSPSTELCQLVLKLGDASFQLEKGHSYRVGSSADNEIRINHGTVGEHHARVFFAAEGCIVEDLGSEHGTLIDGRAVTRATVQPGQTIRFGAIEVAARHFDRPTLSSVATGSLPLRQREQPTFTDLMADELRRAPWLTLSLVIHALIFLLLFYLLDTDPQVPGQPKLINLHKGEEVAALETLEEPEETPEIEKESDEVVLIDNPFEAVIEEPSAADFRDVDFAAPGLTGSAGWLTRVSNKGAGILGDAKVAAGGFGTRVKEIRRTGLEIVFVFDSTGSMTSVLDGTKAHISRMVDVLHALVPDARIGIITYRDRGRSEEYLTRSIPLSDDVYRAINFMHVIRAAGGGDRAEAVAEAMRDAFQQNWRSKSRRVVVLVGDAPAHTRDEQKLARLVRNFSGNGRSFVHAIVTSEAGRNNLPSDTLGSFRQIARAGKGECIGFEDADKVLRQVLSLAFGPEFRKNIDEVFHLVDERKKQISTRTLDAVRHEDIEAIDRRLRQRPIDDDLVKALLRKKSRKLAHHLVGVLANPAFPESGRQAAAHVLQKQLGLLEPPNDPEKGGRISQRDAERLNRLVDKRL